MIAVEKEEELEELEMDIEIGCPTDVQHVAHIGWDGITATADPISNRGWNSFLPPELLSLSPQSLGQQEVSNLDSKDEASSLQKHPN